MKMLLSFLDRDSSMLWTLITHLGKKTRRQQIYFYHPSKFPFLAQFVLLEKRSVCTLPVFFARNYFRNLFLREYCAIDLLFMQEPSLLVYSHRKLIFWLRARSTQAYIEHTHAICFYSFFTYFQKANPFTQSPSRMRTENFFRYI